MSNQHNTVFSVPPPDPMGLFKDWFDNALDEEIKEPGAMALATASGKGHASNRIVQVLDVRNSGLVFTTHTGSAKGREIAETNWASGVLYWRELSQQVIVSGPTTYLSDAESDFLWANRNVSTHPMSVVSRQSDPLVCEASLRTEALRLQDANKPIPRPDNWRGYQLEPAFVEFWQADPDRLHQRLRYACSEGGWTSERLQP